MSGANLQSAGFLLDCASVDFDRVRWRWAGEIGLSQWELGSKSVCVTAVDAVYARGSEGTALPGRACAAGIVGIVPTWG